MTGPGDVDSEPPSCGTGSDSSEGPSSPTLNAQAFAQHFGPSFKDMYQNIIS